jgi:hypothetical protein
MNERPMRQLSLRAFRDSIASLRAPVEVSKRDSDGNILVLGYWTPYAQHPPDSKPIEPLSPGEKPTATISVLSAEGGTIRPPVTLEIPIDDDEPGFPVSEDSEFDRHPRTAPRVISSAEEAAAVVRADPIRAVPKPSQRKRRSTDR